MLRFAVCTVLVLTGAFPSLRADAESGTDYQVLKKIKVEGDGGWDYLTFDSSSHRLYISRATRVQVLDVDQQKVVGEVANTPGVHGIALVPEQGSGYTSNGRDDTVTVFDLQSLQEKKRIPVGKRPDAIIYDPGSRRVFTMNGGSHDATAIDVATNTVAGTVKLGGRPEFAAADGQGHVYVNLEDKDQVAAFDSRELKVQGTWALAPGEGPSGLAIDREHHRLFSTCHNQKMIVLNADTGALVTTVPIGRGTDAAAFDPGARLAFSSNGDGTLTMVQEENADKYRVVANVKTQAGARTMALDPQTHRIYLVTAAVKQGTGQAKGKGGGGRRQFEPGSFVVLVVGPATDRH